MSTLDIAKDILRIAGTAGLAKDVIDLLEKKLAILEKEQAMLTHELALAKLKITKLESENNQLDAFELIERPPCAQRSRSRLSLSLER